MFAPLESILNKTLRERGGVSSHNPYVDFLELALRIVKGDDSLFAFS